MIFSERIKLNGIQFFSFSVFISARCFYCLLYHSTAEIQKSVCPGSESAVLRIRRAECDMDNAAVRADKLCLRQTYDLQTKKKRFLRYAAL